VLSYLTQTKQDSSIANFVLYHRRAVNALASMKDKNRYYPMLSQLIGFNYVKVEVVHGVRKEGKSSYSLSKRLNVALNTILTFSDKPLRIAVILGVGLTFASILLAIIMVILYLFSDIEIKGWASLSLLLSFFSGSIITILGMVGLYVGRIFEGVKQRPTYIIQDEIN